MTVEFKFKQGDLVVNLLGETGFVDSLSFKDTKQYYVMYAAGRGHWVNEEHLKPAIPAEDKVNP